MVQLVLSVVSAQVAAAELEVKGFLKLGLEVLVLSRADFTTAQKVVDVEPYHGD